MQRQQPADAVDNISHARPTHVELRKHVPPTMAPAGVEIEPRGHGTLDPEHPLVDEAVIATDIQPADLKVGGGEVQMAVADGARGRPLVGRVVLVEAGKQLAGQVGLEGGVAEEPDQRAVDDRRVLVLRPAQVAVAVGGGHVGVGDEAARAQQLARQRRAQLVVSREVGERRGESRSRGDAADDEAGARVGAAWQDGRVGFARLAGRQRQRLPRVADGEGEGEPRCQAIRGAHDHGAVRQRQFPCQRHFHLWVADRVAAAVEQHDERPRCRCRALEVRCEVADDDARGVVVAQFDPMLPLGDFGRSCRLELFLDFGQTGLDVLLDLAECVAGPGPEARRLHSLVEHRVNDAGCEDFLDRLRRLGGHLCDRLQNGQASCCLPARPGWDQRSIPLYIGLRPLNLTLSDRRVMKHEHVVLGEEQPGGCGFASD